MVDWLAHEFPANLGSEPMPTIADAAQLLETYAPLSLAEEWDNVGLLVGDPGAPLGRIMTCLTVAPKVVEEAIDRGVDLIVAHHPLPFHPLRRLTTDTVEGHLLWRLMGAGIGVYSAHTAFDSAAGGINEQLAGGLGLSTVRPFSPSERPDGAGTGRLGAPPAGTTLSSLAKIAKQFLGLPHLRVVGTDEQPIGRLAIACGSGGSLLDDAVAAGSDALLTGEATYHECLKAESLGVALLLTGHYASERFAMETLAQWLSDGIKGVEVEASETESSPLRLF